MDPLTIGAAVLSITAKCYSTVGILYEVRTKYKDAPSTISSICSETTVVSASLSQLQNVLMGKDNLKAILESRPHLASALDCSIIGCMTVFSCLENEIAHLTTDVDMSTLSRRNKARIVWNQDKLRQLLEDLRGQQVALNTLVNLFQIDSLAKIERILERSKGIFEDTARRTHVLRESNPGIEAPESIYAVESTRTKDLFSVRGSSILRQSAAYEASDLEFDFDDQVINSKAYRRAMARAKALWHSRSQIAVNEDLIDLSDDKTVRIPQAESSLNRSLLDLAELLPEFDTKLQIENDTPSLETQSSASDGCSYPKGIAELDSLPSRPLSAADITSTGGTPRQERRSVCFRCKSELSGERVCALGKSYHRMCFRCFDCDEVLSTKYHLCKGEEAGGEALPVCTFDHCRRLDLLCYKCGDPLRTSYITALGTRKYHPEHFGCDVCEKTFKAQDAFYADAGNVYCYEHHLRLVHSCAGCGQPIVQEYCEVRARREDSSEQEPAFIGRWHPECYKHELQFAG